MNDDDEDATPSNTIIPKDQLDELPEDQREIIEQTISQFEMVRSPLLPPKILREYGEVVPGLEKKLVEWVESETKHRQMLEQASFDEAKSLRSRAQFSGPLVAVVSLLAAATIAIFSPTAAGAAIAIAIVIVIAGVGGPFAARTLANKWNSRDDINQD